MLRTHGRSDCVKTVNPPTNTVCGGGITKALISCVVTVFVFANAKSRFSHDMAHLQSALLPNDLAQDVKTIFHLP